MKKIAGMLAAGLMAVSSQAWAQGLDTVSETEQRWQDIWLHGVQLEEEIPTLKYVMQQAGIKSIPVLSLRYANIDLDQDGDLDLIIRYRDPALLQKSSSNYRYQVMQRGENDFRPSGSFTGVSLQGRNTDGWMELMARDALGTDKLYRINDGTYQFDLSSRGQKVEMIEADFESVAPILQRDMPDNMLTMQTMNTPTDRIRYGRVDLNGDGEPESFVAVEYAALCSRDKGCNLLLYTGDLSLPPFDMVTADGEIYVSEDRHPDRLKEVYLMRAGVPHVMIWKEGVGYELFELFPE